MSCLEYHEVPLSEAGILREGQEHVWFKDLAHDVLTYLILRINRSFASSQRVNYLME